MNSLSERQAHEQILRHWQHVLAKENIQRKDDFFKLGGHSLLAVKLVIQLEAAFQIKIPLETIFEQSELGTFSNAVAALLTDPGAVRLVQQQAVEETGLSIYDIIEDLTTDKDTKL